MLLKILRNGLGYIIVLFNWLTLPKPIKREKADQAQVNQQLKGLSLYQFTACPFCVKTRRELHRLNLNIEIRDLNKREIYRNELLKGGGQIQVPCLRIEDSAYTENGRVEWLYESKDINAYLRQRFDHSTAITSTNL